MEPAIWLLVFTVILALFFDFINGFHDSANAIATTVATKALTPGQAVIYAAVLNFAGALAGTEVAATIGKGLVETDMITIQTIICALLSAIIWNLLTWWKGLPSSSSHALIGSILGAGFVSTEMTNSIHWNNVVSKVLLPMFTSPIVGLLVGFLVMKLLYQFTRRINLSKNHHLFRKMQIFSAGFMAFEHGRNDAQKSMGVIALALLLTFPQTEFKIPIWVILCCAISMAIGTWTGGWRIIKTLGYKLIKLEPINGFSAETTASVIISAASHFGIPVSTTQVISSSILGVGAAKKLNEVRWAVFVRILYAWGLTLPMTFALAILLTRLGQFMVSY